MRPRSIRIGRIAVYGGMVERGYNGANPTWLGFAYGSWLPRARVSRQGPAWCLDARWLCFFTSIYWNDRSKTP